VTIPTIEDIRDAVDGRNDMVHAVYQYRCERCNSVELIGLGCGVEGPKTGATMHAWIPSPFMCQCTVCGGMQSHVDWKRDAHFPLRDAPATGRYFKVPKDGPDRKRYQSSMFAGEWGNENRPMVLGRDPSAAPPFAPA